MPHIHDTALYHSGASGFLVVGTLFSGEKEKKRKSIVQPDGFPLGVGETIQEESESQAGSKPGTSQGQRPGSKPGTAEGGKREKISPDKKKEASLSPTLSLNRTLTLSARCLRRRR